MPLSPLMDACEREIEFNEIGEIFGITSRAKETICILNINEKNLKERRRRFIIDAIYPNLYGKSNNPPFDLQDKDLLQKFVQELLTTDDSGNLDPFSPILVNICNKIISKL